MPATREYLKQLKSILTAAYPGVPPIFERVRFRETAMSQVRGLKNWGVRTPFHLLGAIESRFKFNSFHTHGPHTRKEKCCTKPLSKDLAVYLVRRLVQTQFLEQTRQLLVSHIPPNHLGLYQLFRSVLPLLIRRSFLHRFAFWRVHVLPLALARRSPVSWWNIPAAIFGRIRPMRFLDAYRSSEGHFTEDKLINKTLDAGRCAEHVAFRTLIACHFAIPRVTRGGAK